MNLGLLDPFGQNYPEKTEAILQPPEHALTCAFNRWGTMLATGLTDGSCIVWDFDTKGVARVLRGHVRPVVSVSWSRSGRRLLTASHDANCILWDLLLQDGTKRDDSRYEVRFDSALNQAVMHPRRNLCFVACPHQNSPVLVEFVKGEDDKLTKKKTVLLASQDNEETHSSFVACFDRKGDRLFLGDTRGNFFVIVMATLQVIAIHRVESKGTIRSIKWSSPKKNASSHLLINAMGKIKVYSIDTVDALDKTMPLPQYEFQEVVSRSQWNQACFSADAEFVIGGSASIGEHKIYIWDRNVGNLIKILEGEGPREGLIDLAWHPVRPIIASIGSFGNILIWGIAYQENWSAYAPDFKELEENVEYEEREDEFDTVPEEELKQKDAIVEELVDIETVDRVTAYGELSDGEQEEEPELLFLPTLLEDPTVGTAIPPRIVEDSSHVDNQTVASSSSSVTEPSKKRRNSETES